MKNIMKIIMKQVIEHEAHQENQRKCRQSIKMKKFIESEEHQGNYRTLKNTEYEEHQ